MVYVQNIFIVGPLPPPIHGMALVTTVINDRLAALGARTTTINLAADSLNRALHARFARIRRVLFGLVRFVLSAHRQPKSVLYIAISGGWGQVYELLFVILARLFRLRIYLHHHNIGYMTTHKRLTHWLALAAGLNATHIVASEKLGLSLKELYPLISDTFALSAVIVTDKSSEDSLRERAGIKTIGFIGNISESKGIFDFLRLVEVLEDRGCKLLALIAGPFQGADIEAKVRKRLQDIPSIRYIGPKYGRDKAKFYNSIDVLLFPVSNEYEGIVIHEAMSFGVPVIARDSGCIAEILHPEAGHLIKAAEDYPEKACACIYGWLAAPDSLKGASHVAIHRFASFREENIKRLDWLCYEMMGQPQFQSDMRGKEQ